MVENESLHYCMYEFIGQYWYPVFDVIEDGITSGRTSQVILPQQGKRVTPAMPCGLGKSRSGRYAADLSKIVTSINLVVRVFKGEIRAIICLK